MANQSEKQVAAKPVHKTPKQPLTQRRHRPRYFSSRTVRQRAGFAFRTAKTVDIAGSVGRSNINALRWSKTPAKQLGVWQDFAQSQKAAVVADRSIGDSGLFPAIRCTDHEWPLRARTFSHVSLHVGYAQALRVASMRSDLRPRSRSVAYSINEDLSFLTDSCPKRISTDLESRFAISYAHYL